MPQTKSPWFTRVRVQPLRTLTFGCRSVGRWSMWDFRPMTSHTALKKLFPENPQHRVFMECLLFS